MSDKSSESGRKHGNCEQGTETLSPREIRFADAIAAGGTISDGATAAGISYRSASRWKVKDRIAAAIRSRTTESLSQARAVLAAGARSSAVELVRLAKRARPDSARVTASRAVLDAAIFATEIASLEERLVELESALAARAGRP
jgi:molybdenum-dependent DNA-binding transcriptional regulator ModE